MLIIFALVFGGGFGGWGNRGGSPVTEADLCNANSFSELKGQVGRMNDQQAAIARQTDNGICQLGYQTLEQSNSIMQQIANCCCTTQRAVDSVKFDMANYASASNANTAAWGQKICARTRPSVCRHASSSWNCSRQCAALFGIRRRPHLPRRIPSAAVADSTSDRPCWPRAGQQSRPFCL